jgi:LysR family cyn operon transcriptional activator
MDLRQLRYFQAVAAAGRIGEAARQLGVSQPALSIALGKLEREVGVELLIRDHRGVQLTPAGRELLGAVEQATSVLEEGRLRIAGLADEPVGRFAIGCPHVLGSYFMPGFVGAFMAAYPRIDLVLWNGTSRQVEVAVLDREVQLGLVTHPLAHPDLVLVDLFHDQVALFADAAIISGERPLTWAAATKLVRARPLLYVPHVPQALEILTQLDTRGLAPSRRLECGDVQLVKELALAGTGVAILPRRVASHGQGSRLEALHPRLPSVADTIRLVYRADTQRTRAAGIVKEALVAHGRAIASEANQETNEPPKRQGPPVRPV